MEAEPNDEPAKAQPLASRARWPGSSIRPRDVDWFRFEAEAGEVYWLEVFSHRLGLDTDPCLVVQKVTRDAAGQEQVTEVASVDDPANRAARIGGDFDASTDDPVYRFAVAEKGTLPRDGPRPVRRNAQRPAGRLSV